MTTAQRTDSFYVDISYGLIAPADVQLKLFVISEKNLAALAALARAEGSPRVNSLRDGSLEGSRRTSVQLPAIGSGEGRQPGARRQNTNSKRLFQNGQIRISRNNGPCACGQCGLDHDVVLGVATHSTGEGDGLNPKSRTPDRRQPGINIDSKPLLRLDFPQNAILFVENVLRNNKLEPASQPSPRTKVWLMTPENTRHQNSGVENSQCHARRAFRKARSTMAAASSRDCGPAGRCRRSLATSFADGGLIGRSSSPVSPRSNTFNSPPWESPSRLRQSSGKMDKLFFESFRVETFIGERLLPANSGATFLFPGCGAPGPV